MDDMTSKPQADPNYRSKEEVHSIVKTIEKVYMLDRPISGDSDRREIERRNVTMPVGITPQQKDAQELNYLHHGITRDISNKGIGLITTAPIRPGVVMLTIEPCHGKAFDVIARVIFAMNSDFISKSDANY